MKKDKRSLADRVFNVKESTLITTEHPKADLVCEVLSKGICATLKEKEKKQEKKEGMKDGSGK